MKKFILALVLACSFVFMFNGYAMYKEDKPGVECEKADVEENAGSMLDWCDKDHISCRHCRDYTVPGVVIDWTECEAHC